MQTKLKVTAVTIALLVVAAVCVWQRQKSGRLMAEAAALREQVEQAATLREENQRLVEKLKADTERTEADRSELVRLRAQAATMRQTEQENARLKAERDRLTTLASQTPRAQPQGDPFDQQHGQGAGAKASYAKHWGYAAVLFAANHQGQFPGSLDEVASLLPDELSEEEKAQTKLAKDQFELVYHGLRDDLAQLPTESTLIIRERQPWLNLEGRWAKIYVWSDGSSGIRTQRDPSRFDSWERIRIPKAPGQ
jgi:hypothetical protein